MDAKNKSTGSFTLPGESGYEKLTLDLAKKWGADVIRDSDGTKLSDEIINAGYDIYSTICIIREDNEWAKQNMDKLQQNFLMSIPVIADSDTVVISPIKGYFDEQFKINGNDDPKKYWQVFDRTTNEEVSISNWSFDIEAGTVTVTHAKQWHKYTVNFLVYRIWEEISMYNHITNKWGDKEHLMAIEPRHPETQKRMLEWLETWCKEHPSTNVIRFTSMFYNFVWIWGDDLNNRHLFADWASYDFTVNPIALDEFERTKGYKITSEVFINKGRHNSTHRNPSPEIRDFMDFTNQFVTEFGKKCVEIAHKYNKKAYVFYDDGWVGVEPYSERFEQFGFDGIIKCVFSGFEVRKCAGVKGVKTHELRLHPYLFPTGLKGEPTFSPGGDPMIDAKRFWLNVRRALLRATVDRIGLGGYLHLVEPFPDFCDYMAKIADEFRLIKSLHEDGAPYNVGPKVAILTSWGKLRSWICSGHLHEHPEVDLTNVLDALSGLPFDVEFISFDDIRSGGIPTDVNVIINAGTVDSAWSGGDNWNDPIILERVTAFVANDGGLIGINEPSAQYGADTFFRLSDVLGVDKDNGERICAGRYKYSLTQKHFITEIEGDFSAQSGIYITDKAVKVLKEVDGKPVLTANNFRAGRSVYMSSFSVKPKNTKLLMNAILWAGGFEDVKYCICSNYLTECAYYPASGKLVFINNSEIEQQTCTKLPDGKEYSVTLQPLEIHIIG